MSLKARSLTRNKSCRAGQVALEHYFLTSESMFQARIHGNGIEENTEAIMGGTCSTPNLSHGAGERTSSISSRRTTTGRTWRRHSII